LYCKDVTLERIFYDCERSSASRLLCSGRLMHFRLQAKTTATTFETLMRERGNETARVTYRTFLLCCAALESNRYLLVRIAVYRIFSFHADEKLQDYRTICSAFLNLRWYFAGILCHINVRVIVSPMNVCQS